MNTNHQPSNNQSTNSNNANGSNTLNSQHNPSSDTTSGDSDLNVVQAAIQLAQSEQHLTMIDPFSDHYPDISIAQAYHIQLENVRRRVANGEIITGKKVGLTSKVMQEMFNVNEPDYGHLFTNMHITDGTVPAHRLIQPRVEGEIAFILKQDLALQDNTVEDVLAATDYVCASIEVVDSRVRDWKFKIYDTIADNGSSAMYQLGDIQLKPSEIDLVNEHMTLSQNGELINEGYGKAALGNPAYCVAWLANAVGAYGITLKAGEVILSGALSAAIPASSGDTFEVEFANLGKLQLHFS